MSSALLVSATYDSASRLAVLKFYEPKSQKIILWKDNTGHKPYCYAMATPSMVKNLLRDRNDIVSIEPASRKNLAEDKEITMTKITVKDPLAIGGTSSSKSVRNLLDTWESDIKYYENYLYDSGLIVGKYYKIENARIQEDRHKISAEVNAALKSLLWDKTVDETVVDVAEFQKFMREWAQLLNQPIPPMRRVAVDIEVDAEEGRIPDPKIAERRITAVGFCGTGGFNRVLVLDSGMRGDRKTDENVELVFYTNEAKMLQDAFDIMSDFPFVLTYNGDDFDLPYMYNRAMRLHISDDKNPLYMMRNAATLRHGVHIDLYRTMSNRSFQIYAFSMKYTTFSLDDVSEALLGEKKIDYGKPLGSLTAHELANYCYNDARLTLKLTTFGNDLLMNLLIIISRIGRMPVDDIARLGVSQWIRSLLFYEHRRKGAIIPRQQELQSRSAEVTGDAVIKNKKFRGGLVIDPVEGVHFMVTVVDFASLYPSIIKVRNLSYETVRCPHSECKSNTIPQTNHWVCSKKNGITALIIGSLRDLRVNYYKALSRSTNISGEERAQYTVIAQALKVILNASYGVMGADIFPLYFLPAAEATTAIGRHTIQETAKMCKEHNITVLYGDTDSLFLKDPTTEQIRRVIDTAKRIHSVDLEVDKEYRYCVLSNRKKNYFGVTKSGNVDIKGLTGKKSHTPIFIKELFIDIVSVLSEVHSMEEFVSAKKKVSDKISDVVTKMREGQIPVNDMAFNMTMSKNEDEYIKMTPQHVRAARILKTKTGRPAKRGDIISYIKTSSSVGVKPAELAQPSEVDPKKYEEFMKSVLSQITSPMNLNFDDMLAKHKQTGLDQFFWG